MTHETLSRIQEYKYSLFDYKGIHFVSALWFGPGIDCAITQHIETIYVQYIYLVVKCLGLVQFLSFTSGEYQDLFNKNHLDVHSCQMQLNHTIEIEYEICNKNKTLVTLEKFNFIYNNL